MTLTASHAPAFSIADLEAYDPQGTEGGRERRFLCPLCGEGKPRDTAHRSFCANVQTGAWNCKRCAATGKLTDFWAEPQKTGPRNGRDPARRQLAQRFALPAPAETFQGRVEPDVVNPITGTVPGIPGTDDWRGQLRGARLIDDATSAAYLLSRGITERVACLSALSLAPNFYGRPAVVFPLRDFNSKLTGASGRYFHANATPKTRIAGQKRDAVFTAPVVEPRGRVFLPLAANGPGVIIAEAPIDALSLATAGYPSIALCGTSAPSWIHRACGLKRVFMAFDADEAGDAAADKLTAALEPFGASCERLRPEGGKDWNEVLQAEGQCFLADFLASKILSK